MKKDEAIKYITNKGFTKRMAGKIYANAIACLEVEKTTLDTAINEIVMNAIVETNENMES